MWSLYQLSHVFVGSDTERSAALLAEAEAILQALGPTHYAPEEGLRVRATFAVRRSDLASWQGRHLEAKLHAAESIQLHEASGTPWFAAFGHDAMADACANLGEYREAREHLLAALSLSQPFEDWPKSYTLLRLAELDVREGNLERALAYGLEGIRQVDMFPHPVQIASNLGLLATISAQQGQPVRAARLAGAAAAVVAGLKLKPWQHISLDTLMSGWRDGPDRDAIQASYDAGQAMSSDEAVAYALKDQAT
jgi:hypothetical protein